MDSSLPTNVDSAHDQQTTDESSPDFSKRILFFLGITAMSAIGGFGAMLSRAERQNQKNNNPSARPDPAALESGTALARKALGRATLYAVSGFTLFCFVSWKVIGAKDFEEFRLKLGNAFPRIHRPREPEEIDWDDILYGKKENESKIETDEVGTSNKK